MEGNRFTYCPQCGSTEIQTVHGGQKWQCPVCRFDLYNNVASAVGLVIRNAQGELLFEKRAKEPRKGFLAFPGGFTGADESGEEAARRECMEEIGVCPQDLRYLCSFPNTYEYRGIVYKTCDMFFTASLPQDAPLRAQESEVSAFVWRPVRSVQDVEELPLAFPSARNTLLRWLEMQQ